MIIMCSNVSFYTQSIDKIITGWKKSGCMPSKIDYGYLSLNENAIPILEKNLDKVNWYMLSDNRNAIHILEQNLDKVYWSYL